MSHPTGWMHVQSQEWQDRDDNNCLGKAEPETENVPSSDGSKRVYVPEA